jgi:nucleoside-diphosphate-sugar epimerase
MGKILVTCPCGTNFLVHPYRLKVGRGKFCSKDCFYTYRSIRPSNLTYNVTTNNGWFKKGRVPSNKKDEPLEHEHKKIRQSSKYRKWRESVLARDNSKCVFCDGDDELNVDHIRPFSRFPELRFDLSNGRTLCIECHKKTPTYGRSCKKIFITGVCGYLGDAVVEYLLDMGHYVYGIDNLTYTPHYLREHELFDFYGIDIRDESKVLSILNDIKPDAIIHLAAIVGDAACSVSPNDTKLINVDATKFISEYCEQNSVRLIFASTCSVFGASNNMLTEDSKTAPLSLYGSTKLIAEDFVKKSNGFIFRMGTLYGLSSSFARIRCDLVSNIMTIRSIENKTLEVYGGEQYRPILHVRDAARIFAIAATKKYKNEEFGSYILSDRNFKILDMANRIVLLISKMTGITSDINITEMSFEDARNYKVDAKKSYRCGFKPTIDFDFGIKELTSFLLEGRISNPWDSRYHNARYLEERCNG